MANAPGYNVLGVGDINGSGYADIVAENQTTGAIVYANMTGGTFQNWVNVSTAAGWSVVGVGNIVGPTGNNCEDSLSRTRQRAALPTPT